MTGEARISVVVPVLRERGINGLLEHLRSFGQDGAAEVVVVDGDPAGSTLTEIGDPRAVKVLSPPGRGTQMNRGAARADGDILLFLHADTRLPATAFALIRRALAGPDIVGGCFSLGIDSPRWYFRVTERYAGLRTRLTRVPFGDQAVFLRKAYFDSIGGYRDIPIMEDVELLSRVRNLGGRIAILPERVSTSARRWEQEGVLFTTCRNWALQLAYLAGVPPERLARFYR